jgi:hypothetical protein
MFLISCDPITVCVMKNQESSAMITQPTQAGLTYMKRSPELPVIGEDFSDTQTLFWCQYQEKCQSHKEHTGIRSKNLGILFIPTCLTLCNDGTRATMLWLENWNLEKTHWDRCVATAGNSCYPQSLSKRKTFSETWSQEEDSPRPTKSPQWGRLSDSAPYATMFTMAWAKGWILISIPGTQSSLWWAVTTQCPTI